MSQYTRKPNCNCSICQKPIYRRPFQIKNGPVYCSKECYFKSCTIFVACKICGKKFKSSLHKKTCSRECANKNRIGLKYRQGSPKDKVRIRNLLKEKLIELRGSKCQNCSNENTKILHVHHIIERSEGGSNELDNLLLICPNCHAEIHYGK